jgi:endogenous inhibitor of DNA gyrase (YacG/DUF329 family)
MRLTVGDEFRDPAPPQAKASGRDRPRYRVTGVLREERGFGLYEGKKVFTNFHFGRRDLEETADEESLDVLLKALIYPDLESRESVKELREQLFFECSRVLGRARQRSREPLSNLLPEPIDYLQIPNDRDAFAFANPRQTALYEPILVLERVRGLPLDRWLSEKKPSTVRILRVLGSLLDLLGAAHAEGLLLTSLAPADVWVNDDDRPHYLGSGFVLDAGRQQKQRKLYPPERYAAGFGPPELYGEGQTLDARTDLYSWAALAYFLLARDDLGLIAKGQGERFVRFDDARLACLEPALRAVPSSSLSRIQHSFRVAGSRLAHTWPDGLLNVLRECLRPRPEDRPSSREALAGLWAGARPRPVPAALAIHRGRQVEVLIAARDLEPGLEMVVRRCAASFPRAPDEGDLITEGAMAGRALDRNPLPDAACYAVFSRARTDAEPIYSLPTEAPLLSVGRPDVLLSFAEQVAASEPAEWPPRVALLEELADANPVARALLGSPTALVRRWAVRLLEGQLKDRKTREEAREMLLTRGLADSDASVREACVRALFRGERRPEVDLVLRVATALGNGNLDASIAAARELTEIDEGVVAEVLRRLEGERPVPCPVCQQPVRAAGLNDHLVRGHNFVNLGGPPVPYGEALQELWRRLLAEQDARAAAQLVNLLVDRHADKAESMFRNAFEAQLGIHAAALGPFDPAAPSPAWSRVAERLGEHELTQRVCRSLLTHADDRLRAVARLALIPLVAKRLAGKADNAAFLTSLEALCPGEPVPLRLAVCRQLAEAGASKKAAKEVAAALELDRDVNCPECGRAIRRREEAEHLRREHGLYEIEGARCPWDEALKRLMAALLAAKPDRKAAGRYVEVASDRLKGADLAARMAADLANEARSRASPPPLERVAALSQAGDVFRRLIDDGNGRLALPLFAAMGKGASLTVLERAAALIADASLPGDERRQAAGLILTSRNAEAGTRERAIDAFLSGQGDPLLALELLDDLATAAPSPAVEARRQRLYEQTTLPCPACQTVLNLKALQDHAWRAHGLVLMRGAWRPTWEAIGAWLDEYARTGDEMHLNRAQALALLDDPQLGRFRLGGLAASKGIRHPSLVALPQFSWRTMGCVLAAVLAIAWLLWLLFRR